MELERQTCTTPKVLNKLGKSILSCNFLVWYNLINDNKAWGMVICEVISLPSNSSKRKVSLRRKNYPIFSIFSRTTKEDVAD